jgi:hypothetical protein
MAEGGSSVVGLLLLSSQTPFTLSLSKGGYIDRFCFYWHCLKPAVIATLRQAQGERYFRFEDT